MALRTTLGMFTCPFTSCSGGCAPQRRGETEECATEEEDGAHQALEPACPSELLGAPSPGPLLSHINT